LRYEGLGQKRNQAFKVDQMQMSSHQQMSSTKSMADMLAAQAQMLSNIKGTATSGASTNWILPAAPALS
jgi:hypothetical protein